MILAHAVVVKNIRSVAANRTNPEVEIKRHKTIIRFLKLFLLLLALFLVAICFYGIVFEARSLNVRRYDYANSQIPKDFIGKKIVFASDFHAGFGFLDTDSIVAKIAVEKPDLLLLGGDYADSDPKYTKELLKKMKTLDVPFGIYGVFGNHDNIRKHYGETSAIFKELEIKSINNNSYWITSGDSQIKVGGVGDYQTDSQKLFKTTGDVNKDDFAILVSHSPDYFEKLSSDKVDLIFSGHTHGGQIGLLGWYPIVPSKYHDKYLSGRFDKQGETLFVSRGIGTTDIPMRYGAKPDILAITLK
jgi:hypothetical protein